MKVLIKNKTFINLKTESIVCEKGETISFTDKQVKDNELVRRLSKFPTTFEILEEVKPSKKSKKKEVVVEVSPEVIEDEVQGE